MPVCVDMHALCAIERGETLSQWRTPDVPIVGEESEALAGWSRGLYKMPSPSDFREEPKPREYLSTWMFPPKLDTSWIPETQALKPSTIELTPEELQSLRYRSPTSSPVASPSMQVEFNFDIDPFEVQCPEEEEEEDSAASGMNDHFAEESESRAEDGQEGMGQQPPEESHCGRRFDTPCPTSVLPAPVAIGQAVAFSAPSPAGDDCKSIISSDNEGIHSDYVDDSAFVPASHRLIRPRRQRSPSPQKRGPPESSSSAQQCSPSIPVSNPNKRKASAMEARTSVPPTKVRKHPPEQLYCRVRLSPTKICTHRAKTPSECFKHRDTHFPPRFLCPECDTAYARDSTIKRHLTTVPPDPRKDATAKCRARFSDPTLWGTNMSAFAVGESEWKANPALLVSLEELPNC